MSDYEACYIVQAQCIAMVLFEKFHCATIHKFTKKTAKRIIQKEVESFKIQRSPPTCIRIGVHRSLSEPSHMLAGHPQGRPRPLPLSQAFLSFESS